MFNTCPGLGVGSEYFCTVLAGSAAFKPSLIWNKQIIGNSKPPSTWPVPMNISKSFFTEVRFYINSETVKLSYIELTKTEAKILFELLPTLKHWIWLALEIDVDLVFALAELQPCIITGPRQRLEQSPSKRWFAANHPQMEGLVDWMRTCLHLTTWQSQLLHVFTARHRVSIPKP